MFAEVCEFQWTKVKWCFKNVFFHFIVVWYENVKINYFEEKKKYFRCRVNRIEVHTLTNWSRRLEKTPNTSTFCVGRIFSLFSNYNIFEIFENRQSRMQELLNTFYLI